MKILDLIFPPTCEFCGKVGKYVCDNCYKKVIYLELKKTKKNDKFFMYKYDEEIRKLILKYKFGDKSYLCNFFADKICDCKEAVDFISNYDMIIPVPLHKKRLQERGFNQTKEVVKLISKKLKNIKCENNVLKKCKNTIPQSMQNGNSRKSNVENVFYVNNASIIANKNVLIFDDIYTTGATANECKKALIKAGAKKCGIMAIARDFMD